MDMNKLLTELVQSDIGLELSDVTVTDKVFAVKTRPGGPKIIFGLLFGVPGILLLFLVITSFNWLTLLLAIVFCPVLFVVALLFGVSISEKIFDREKGQFISRLHVLHLTWEEVLPLPHDAIVLKSENRGSSKTGSGSFIRYSAQILNTPGAGFALSRDYFKMSAFANQLGTFLNLPVEDTVLEVNRIVR